MRIIAKERDVYDLQHALFDAERVWVREPSTFQVRVNKETESLVKRFAIAMPGNYGWSREEGVFCHPVQIASEIHWLFSVGYWENGQRATFKTFDAAKLKGFLESKDATLASYFYKVKSVEQLVEKVKESSQEAYRILTKMNVPLSMVNRVTKSATDETKYFEILTNFSFHKLGLPWQEIDENLYRVHQTIESYIWGVIGNGEKQVVEVSDLDRLRAHGFDEKFSFRNRGK